MISQTQRHLPDTTQQTQETYLHAPGGIQTSNPSSPHALDRAAAGIGCCVSLLC